MADTNSSPGKTPDMEDVAEIEPDSKRGEAGRAAHGGDRAGPGSHQSGKPQAPQTGDPKRDDRSQG